MSVPATDSGTLTQSDPTGLHRVLDDAGRGRVLPQAAQRLDTRREIWPDEVRVRVETLNLDAASFRQLETKHDHNGDAVRREVLEIVATRGKMQNPVTGLCILPRSPTIVSTSSRTASPSTRPSTVCFPAS